MDNRNKKSAFSSFITAMALAVERMRLASRAIGEGIKPVDNGYKRSRSHRNTAKNKRLAKKRRNIAMYNR